MKTLLVLAGHPELGESVRAALNNRSYRIIHRTSLADAEPLLAHSLCDACILDAELSSVQSAWTVDKFRQLAPAMPLLIYASSRQWEWEEEAYLHGANYVLTKPIRAKLLNALLERIWPGPAQLSPRATTGTVTTPQPPASVGLSPSGSLAAVSPELGVLRSFSAILTHSLDAEALLKQFLLLLREIVSLNRGAIFLRNPLVACGAGEAAGADRRLQALGSLGVSMGLLQTVELSLESGIGAQVLQLGRILRRSSDEVRNDPIAAKEFELLNAQVAIPILDRESVLGVALFDGRITGESFVNSELELIFHLLEQVGLAVKNIWLHTQLASNHEMMAGILRELSSGCVVVSRDLTVLHANRTAKKYFTKGERSTGELEFSDLPQLIGAKVYQVLKTGAAVAPFKFEPEDSSGTVFNINIVPFQGTGAGLPSSALLMAEDLTQGQQLQKLEIEAANLRLVRAMADRMTHEIGNAMVPLSTHQQLLADKWKDPEFRASLDAALADGVKRVTRLINQMRFLARDSLVSSDSFPIGPLLEEAFQEARKYQPVKSAQLKYEAGAGPVVLTGDRAALKHAFAEVMLNALQANPADPKIGVRLNPEPVTNGRGGVQIEVQDNGNGFSSESARKAPAPFFTTRNVGLGLGLTVTRKIIETHHGRLEILPPEAGHGVVRISLPSTNSLS
jgi:nitrogen-specific signal transduction histidine kinase/DNA-binding NarL/FixJ family response regulator